MGDEHFWRSGPIKAAIRSGEFGTVVRLAREHRALRQADVAARAGMSRSTLSRVETGRHQGVDVARLRVVADAIGMPPGVVAALLGVAGRPAATVVARDPHPNGPAGPAEEDPLRRRTFLTAAGAVVPIASLARVDDALALTPDPGGAVSAAQLAARLNALRDRYDAGRLVEVVDGLPRLLAVAEQAPEHFDAPGVHALASAAYGFAADALSKVGAKPASRITADRAVGYARRSEDAVAMAEASRALGIVLRHEGRQGIAHQVTLRAAGRVQAKGIDTPRAAATLAQTLCTCAYNAAQADRRDDALMLIGEARSVARHHLPDVAARGARPALTRAQVTLYEVGVHWALGDSGRALNVGAGLDAAMFPTPERKARLHTDLARAWWQRDRPAETARHLLEAHEYAAGEVRDRSSIRRIADALARDHGRVGEVRMLTDRLSR
nr:helix-turn-helix transcriptional regulator [Actinomadura atramentaria]